MKSIELVSKLETVVELHEKMKGAYFYNSPQNATQRRLYEQRNSLVTEFEFENDV